MTNLEGRLSKTCHALADPTRRAVVAALGRGPASVSDLAKPYRMALPTFLQHLKVLEESGLVRSEKVGRVRTCRLQPKPLSDLEGWIGMQREVWSRRLDQFDAFVTALHKKEK